MERLEAVSPWSQFRSGAGYVLALRHRWSSPRPSADLILLGGTVQVAGASLTMKTSQVRGYAAELTLAAEPAGSLELPDDLLSVLGWSWAPLRPAEKGWASRLRLRGREPDVSRLGEARLETTARHLATTLGEAPARFHERLLAARWWAMGRRAIPTLTSLGLVGGLALLRFEAIDQTSVLRLVIFNAPLLLIGLSFTLQEYARIELPPWPRRPRASTWSRPPPAQPEGRQTVGEASVQATRR
jgi:hypothetical protein